MLLVHWREHDRIIEGRVVDGEPRQGRLHSFVRDGHGVIMAMVLTGTECVAVPHDQLLFVREYVDRPSSS